MEFDKSFQDTNLQPQMQDVVGCMNQKLIEVLPMAAWHNSVELLDLHLN